MILTLMKYCEEYSMSLVYLYNSFILNVFLTFFYFFDIYLCGYKV